MTIKGVSLQKRHSAYDYIYTFCGKTIIPGEVKPEQIKIVDIATGLGRIYRFNGQTGISVLRHSVGIANCFEPGSMERKFALFHDAAEAYMMDVPVPLKAFVNELWHSAYEQFEETVFDKYEIEFDSAEQYDLVMLIDKRVVEYEMDCQSLEFSKMRYPLKPNLRVDQIADYDAMYRWDLDDEQIIDEWLTMVAQYGIDLLD